jgi:hypothetical protein
MQGRLTVSWSAAIVAIAMAAAVILVGAAQPTRGDEPAGGEWPYRGNVDCDGYVDAGDVRSLLGALTGAVGAPTNCVDYDGWDTRGCVTPVIPNPTACDVLYPHWVTTVPGDTDFPPRFDANCDGHVDFRDVFALLYFSAGLSSLQPQPSGCPIGNPSAP